MMHSFYTFDKEADGLVSLYNFVQIFQIDSEEVLE